MRFEGVLASWNDDRGFGFIKNPQPGGKEVFVHISAFPPRRGRPGVGQRLSYELVLEDGGKLRAAAVQLLGPDRSRNAALPRKGSLWALAGLAGLYLWIELSWGAVPAIFPVLYAAASLVAFLAYAIDKRAAQRGGWRIQETTLHLIALAGGWPGAILAQVLLRHKSQKPSFRAVFWLTVLINTGLFAYLCSPHCKPELRHMIDILSSAFAAPGAP